MYAAIFCYTMNNLKKSSTKIPKLLKNDDYEFFTKKKFTKKKSNLRKEKLNRDKTHSASKSSHDQRKLSTTKKKTCHSNKPERMRSCTMNLFSPTNYGIKNTAP